MDGSGELELDMSSFLSRYALPLHKMLQQNGTAYGPRKNKKARWIFTRVYGHADFTRYASSCFVNGRMGVVRLHEEELKLGVCHTL